MADLARREQAQSSAANGQQDIIDSATENDEQVNFYTGMPTVGLGIEY